MSTRKRLKTDEKKQALNSIPITKFEQLPNELILMCFTYFTFHHLYEAFFCLNQRLNKCILSDANIHIDLDSTSDENLLTFCFKLHHFLSQSKNDSLAMSSYKEHRFNLIMKDNLFQDKFSKLKSLKLSNIHAEPIFNAIFDKRMKLYETLERLTLDEVSQAEEHGHDVELLCSRLISSKMKSLKYLDIKLQPYRCGCELGYQSGKDDVDLEFRYLSEEEKSFSNLETLIIGDIPEEDETFTKTKLSFQTLTTELLPCMPKLKNLIIDSIHFNQNRHLQLTGIYQSTIKTDAVMTLNLKSIKIWIKAEWNNEHMDKQNKKLLKNLFLNTNSSDGTTIKTFYINNENVLE